MRWNLNAARGLRDSGPRFRYADQRRSSSWFARRTPEASPRARRTTNLCFSRLSSGPARMAMSRNTTATIGINSSRPCWRRHRSTGSANRNSVFRLRDRCRQRTYSCLYRWTGLSKRGWRKVVVRASTSRRSALGLPRRTTSIDSEDSEPHRRQVGLADESARLC